MKKKLLPKSINKKIKFIIIIFILLIIIFFVTEFFMYKIKMPFRYDLIVK